MNSAKNLPANKATALILATAGLFVWSCSALAQDIQHLTATVPGGMPGTPVITGIEKVNNGVRITWDGPSGYYQLFRAGSFTSSKWQPVGGPTLNRAATVTGITSNTVFRVSGPATQYAGSQSCIECHGEVHATVTATRHTGAFSNPLFKSQGGQTNSSCLPCHTVGYGLPTGFDGKPAKLYLTGVQCESCHGPAANHAANENDITVRPRAELAAQVCGGCHNAEHVPAIAAATHRPYFEEWNTSAHRAVLPELQTDFAKNNGPSFYIPTCGGCHSGTVREALMEGDPLPGAQEAGAIGIACATCHDPHRKYVHENILNGLFTNVVDGRTFVVTNNQLGARYTNQLANPLASLQNYHTTGSFSANYNPDINVCAQCHNDRGASSASTDQAPHHSAQYNVLLGNFRESDTGTPAKQPATHSLLEKQCVACHMQTSNHVSAAQPATAGHTFEVDSYETCARCHQSASNAQKLAAARMANTSYLIGVIKEFYLDAWAVNYAPESLKKYGTRAWEYTQPGELSPGGPGPSTAEQALIPGNIKKARFDLYVVQNEGSFGVHNAGYSLNLLMSAANLVQMEFDK